MNMVVLVSSLGCLAYSATISTSAVPIKENNKKSVLLNARRYLDSASIHLVAEYIGPETCLFDGTFTPRPFPAGFSLTCPAHLELTFKEGNKNTPIITTKIHTVNDTVWNYFI